MKSSAISIPVPATILLAADLNWDGNSDLLAICGDCGSVHMSLGQPGGTFGNPTALVQDAEQLLTSAVLTDINSDGATDLLLTNQGRLSNGFVVQLLGQRVATAPLKSYSYLATPGPAPVALSSAVFGMPPTSSLLAVADSTRGTTSFLDTTLALDKPPSTDATPVALVAGDVDNDKRQDLIIAYGQGMQQGRLHVLSQFGSGTFASVQAVPLLCKPQGLWATDLTRDGTSDILISCTNPSTYLYLLQGSVKSKPVLITLDMGAMYGTPAILDANMDGWMDLLVPILGQNQLVALLGQP